MKKIHEFEKHQVGASGSICWEEMEGRNAVIL